MFVSPASPASYGQRLTLDAAEQVSRNWWKLLANGLLLIVAGVLIFSINWSTRSLATFLGVLFILQGITMASTRGVDRTARNTNIAFGLLSIAAGVVLIVWPGPGLLALAIFLGSWLIVMGTLAITAAFAGRKIVPDWWLLLILGLLEVPLGVLALAQPGATLTAFVLVGGIWAVTVGVMFVVMAFEVRRLPQKVDAQWATPANGNLGAGAQAHQEQERPTAGAAS